MGEGFALQGMGDVVADIERSCSECGKPVSECRSDLAAPGTRLGMLAGTAKVRPVAPVATGKRPEVTLEQVKACVVPPERKTVAG